MVEGQACKQGTWERQGGVGWGEVEEGRSTLGCLYVRVANSDCGACCAMAERQLAGARLRCARWQWGREYANALPVAVPQPCPLHGVLLSCASLLRSCQPTCSLDSVRWTFITRVVLYNTR